MIKFLDLQKINQQYSNELVSVAEEVIKSGWYINGKQNIKFEENLSKYIGVEYTLGVANGLDALKLILRAYIEMGYFHEGDEIIVPSNTFIATILAISENKLIPILVEPDIYTYNMDIDKIESHISNKTKGIIIVHLYGLACWSEKLNELSLKYNLKIIEDNAQAFGAEISFTINNKLITKKTGSLGHAAAFSFYPGKNLGALGDAGAISTCDKELYQTVKQLANYGSRQKYIHDYKGINSRLDEIQAAFLNIKLKYVDEENYIRRVIANYYINSIKNPKIVLPKRNESNDYNQIVNDRSHVWHLFVIKTIKRENLLSYLSNHGIEVLIHYPIPPHKQLAYRELNALNLNLTESIHSNVLSLPISPVLEFNEYNHIVEILNDWK